MRLYYKKNKENKENVPPPDPITVIDNSPKYDKSMNQNTVFDLSTIGNILTLYETSLGKQKSLKSTTLDKDKGTARKLMTVFGNEGVLDFSGLSVDNIIDRIKSMKTLKGAPYAPTNEIDCLNGLMKIRNICGLSLLSEDIYTEVNIRAKVVQADLNAKKKWKYGISVTIL